MIPGVYLFRMMSGLVQIAGGTETTSLLIPAIISAGMGASIIILAMSLGLIVPKLIVDYLGDRSRQAEIVGAAEHVNAR
jgi:uncharacterized membrane protein YjjB (DUF3815 family)